SLVFFDLDGTLMNSQFQIDVEVLKAINIMKNNGHIPIIATERPYSQIKDLITKTEINSYILTNVQYINDEGTVIGNYIIQHSVIDKLQRFLQENEISSAYYNNEDYVITEESHLTKMTFKTFNIPETRVDTKFHKTNEVLMILVFLDDLSKDQILR